MINITDRLDILHVPAFVGIWKKEFLVIAEKVKIYGSDADEGDDVPILDVILRLPIKPFGKEGKDYNKSKEYKQIREALMEHFGPYYLEQCCNEVAGDAAAFVPAQRMFSEAAICRTVSEVTLNMHNSAQVYDMPLPVQIVTVMKYHLNDDTGELVARLWEERTKMYGGK